MDSLSFRRSSTSRFWPSPRISHAVSIALRNPLEHPVPVGQNGYKEEQNRKGMINVYERLHVKVGKYSGVYA